MKETTTKKEKALHGLEDMKITLNMMTQEYEHLSHEKDSIDKRLELLAEKIKDKQHEIFMLLTGDDDDDK